MIKNRLGYIRILGIFTITDMLSADTKIFSDEKILLKNTSVIL